MLKIEARILSIYKISFKSEVIILFTLSIALLIVIIILNYLMHQNRNKVVFQPQIHDYQQHDRFLGFSDYCFGFP